jgi:hypothetical protein
MQTRLLGATALVLVAAVNLSSARAEGRNYRVEPRGPAYRSPSSTMLCPPIRQTPHSKERDAGRHAHSEGHWVLVMAPVQSAAPAHTVNN